MRSSSEIIRVNGIVVHPNHVAGISVPWPLLVMDVGAWLHLLPTLHEMNQEQAMFAGEASLEEQERVRGAAALAYLQSGIRPTPEEHPILALRLLLEPSIVTQDTLDQYARALVERYPGPSAEPFFVVDCRDAVLHLVHELEFLGELVGPGMLATTAPAEWLCEYTLQLLERHAIVGAQ